MKKILLFATLSLLVLVSCSRESDIRVNGTLRNNHSVVFAFTERPDSLDAFVDSVALLDSVFTYDTLTVTVHDSLFFVGFLKYNADKVLRYAWKTGDRDSLLDGKNEELFVYAYDSVGVYSPLFIAVDGANARDTAGRGQYIRVIDTPPDISVESDTFWTRGQKDAVISFFASDSFGSIDSAFVLTLNLKKQATDTIAAKLVDTTAHLYQTKIKYDKVKSLLDTNNNLRYVYCAIDEDGNVSKDTAVLHFNKIPKISLLQPDSNGRYSMYVSRFAFYYSGTDADNPADLRYSIRVGKSPDNAGTVPILTDANLVATGIREKSWEAITDSIWKMDKSLHGRIYWQVSVTDGYDTTTSPTWNFFFGNLSKATGNFNGYAKFQGRTAHNGIQIVFENLKTSNFTFTHTSDKGYFSADVDPGSYRVYARDTTGFGYKYMMLDSLFIEMGDEKLVPTMLLEDSMPPKIRVNKYESIVNSRKVSFSGTLSDSGSQIASAKAWFDGKETNLTTLKVNEWAKNFSDLTDGDHNFKFVVLDSAKNVSDTAKINFSVKASSLNLTVNGKTTALVSSGVKLEFKAYAGNVLPRPDSITWTYTVGSKVTKKTVVGKDSASYLTLTDSNLPSIVAGKFYTMYASAANGVIQDSVRFGLLDGSAIIYFLSPKPDTSVTMHDKLTFTYEKFLADGTTGEVTWSCAETLDDDISCPEKNAEQGVLAWKTTGKKKITITLKTSDNKTVNDTISVNVNPDPPTVTIKTTEDVIRQKINAKISLDVSASDKSGNVTAIKWGCGTNTSNIHFDSSAVVTPAKTVSAKMNVSLPSNETNNFKCIVRATDDDGEFGYDTVSFRAVLDKPTLTLFTHTAEVKINAKVRFAGSATDSLGYIEFYKIYCGTSLKTPTWISISKPDTTLTMPGKACTWHCMMQVTDDDGLTAEDTATYTVLLDPPSVRASEDTMTVTIKDTIELDAIATEKLGQIVLYQWSCGIKGTAGKYFVSSTTTPRYTAIMPSTPANNYLCIIRVTDDDGLTAEDTTKISVLADPPTVKVANKYITTRVNYPIEINATANDKYGYIARREWSCGTPSEINTNWKTVSDYDTTWIGPSSPAATYYCVARATDDDGNQAQDTMFISFTTDIPVITADKKEIYILSGKSIDLTAKVNNAWQGIKRYTWTCGTKGSSALSDTVSKNNHHIWWSVKTVYTEDDFYFWDTDANGKAQNTIATLSKNNTTFYCIVWAQESGTNYVATDTVTIHSMFPKDMPVGVLSLPDTAYLWSYDSSEISSKARYWYTSDINASSSKLGTLGDEDMQQFWWNFSNVNSSGWYGGNSDGTIDTSISEFNAAFLRSAEEGSITIKLDYLDSSMAGSTTMDQDFRDRHKAETVSKKVYFRKAWKNISAEKDSVVEKSTNASAPAIAYCNDHLNIAYVNENSQLVTKYKTGNSWAAFGTPNVSSILTNSLNLECDNRNLYLSYIDSDSNGHVLKSSGASGTWTEQGSGVGSHLTILKMHVNPSSHQPAIASINDSSTVSLQEFNGSSWTANGNINNMLDVDFAFDASGNKTVVSTHSVQLAWNDYLLYYYYQSKGGSLNSGYSMSSIHLESIRLIYNNSTYYLAGRSRDDDGLPKVFKATSNGVSKSNAFSIVGGDAFGHRSYTMYIALDGNKNPILAIDDANYARSAQVHVYRFENGAWGELGENELPYFKNIFAQKKGYYIRGFHPQMAVSPSGTIYLSMHAQEAASSATSNVPGTNNGPMVMEYRGDNW